MDYKLNGLLWHCVLVLMLQWKPVFPAPTHTSCHNNLESTESLTRLLRLEAKELQDEYTKFHDITRGGSVPDDVPDSSISGINISEKLHDVYIKNVLFYLHISKVEEYLNKLWGNQDSVAGPLTRVKGGLYNHLAKLKTLLQTIEPEIPLPATAAPPQLSHDHDYAKKEYGHGVIVRLMDWLTQVLQLLNEAQEVCNK